MIRVFCARYGGIYLMRRYWSSAPLRLLLMYKNVQGNTYFQKESWENVLPFPLQGWPLLHNAALCSLHLISFPVALKVVLIRLFREDFLSALRENTIQMRGPCFECVVFVWLFCLCQRKVIYCNHDWKERKGNLSFDVLSSAVSLNHHQQQQQQQHLKWKIK